MTTLALGACSPYAFGSGSGSGAKPGDDGPTDEGTGTGPEDTTGGPEGSSTTAATAPPGDESVDGPPMDEGPDGHPMVTISDGPMFDFGRHDLAEAVDQAFIVTNEGDGDATAVQVGSLSGAFSIVDHDCSDVLAPGATCEVQVGFAPERFGDVQTELQLDFQDQGMEAMASLTLLGRGVGTTANLVINGGGEEGEATDIPPMGWTNTYGPSWSANWLIGKPVEGDRVISAGWGPPGDLYFTLDQVVDIAAHTTWDDAAGLQIHYRASHRAEGMGDDPTWIEVRVLDGSGGEIGLHPGSLHSGTHWNMSVGTFQAPLGAHSVRISLQCDRMTGDSCSGFFDGIELWAEWAG